MLPHDPDRTPPHVTSLKRERWREPRQKPQHKLRRVMLQLPVLFDNTEALVVVLGMFNGRDEEKRRKGRYLAPPHLSAPCRRQSNDCRLPPGLEVRLGEDSASVHG